MDGFPVPPDFRYRSVLERGRPAHAGDDPFLRRHPAMDRGRRAKIFAPFDALKGFREAVAAREAEAPGAPGSAYCPEKERDSVCCRYYIEKDDPEIRDVLTAVNRSPLADRFLRAGDAVLTDGEIHPTAVVPTVASSRDGRPCVFPMKWGFTIPGIRPVFNARVETASVRSSFREAWEGHRCAIPASWYFEWKHVPSASGRTRVTDKYAIQPAGGAAAWLCGLYRLENSLPHFVVLTREPTEALREIHDRMPLILPAKYVHDWINPLAAPEKMLDLAVTDLVMEKAD